MRKTILAVLLAVAGLAAAKANEVKWVGELHKVMSGDDKPIISLDSVSGLPNLYALGPVAGLNGEITVFNSQPSISRIQDGKVVVESTFHAQAPLLVYAQVPKWTAMPIPSTVKSLADLDKFAGDAGKKAGLAIPFAFRFTGHAMKLDMHIVNRQGREVKGHEDHAKIQVKVPVLHSEVELLGFWTDKHQMVLTHMGSNVHVHGKTADNKISGHVDEVDLGPGQLWLPAK